MSNTAKRILLVEDDNNFGDVLRSYLEMNDYIVDLGTDGEKGLDLYERKPYDLCILDVMMPKMDGFALAERIRYSNKTIPIIFLTAKGMKEDIIQGFKLGADDYIKKPFNSEELLYRIQAILKRSSGEDMEDQEEFNIGQYFFNYPLRTLSFDEEERTLSPKEAELLKMFAMRQNEVLTRSDALKKIWGEDNYFTARSMDVFVTKLRKYLKDDPDIEIANIHGNGFRLVINKDI